MAPEARLCQDWSHGVGSDWYSLLMFNYSGPHGSRPRGLPTWPSPSEAWGQQSLVVHLSPCLPPSLPLFFSDHVRVALQEIVIDHGDITNAITLPWWGRTNLGWGHLPERNVFPVLPPPAPSPPRT